MKLLWSNSADYGFFDKKLKVFKDIFILFIFFKLGSSFFESTFDWFSISKDTKFIKFFHILKKWSENLVPWAKTPISVLYIFFKRLSFSKVPTYRLEACNFIRKGMAKTSCMKFFETFWKAILQKSKRENLSDEVKPIFFGAYFENNL